MKIPINTPQYFLDDELIQDQRKLVRRWLTPKICPEPIIVPDRPWEGRMVSMLGQVLPEPDGGYRMYYTGFIPNQVPFTKPLMCFSDDGFTWTKPELGIVEWNGSKANNILMLPEWHTDAPGIAIDPNDPEFPYKMIAFQCDDVTQFYKSPNCGMYVWKSRDGLHFEKYPGQVLRAGDRSALMTTKQNGKFMFYTRHYDMWEHVGGRAIYLSESEDFLNWTEPELVLAPDLEDEPDVEFYGMPVFERNGWFFGMLEYWRQAIDTVEIQLAISRDGRNWLRPYPRPTFLGNENHWHSKSIYCANSGPIIMNEQMVFYFGGRHIAHDYDSAQQSGAIGYASMPIDRFCAIEGTNGRFTTVPIEWPDADLVVNADTRESFTSHPMAIDGEIAVEVFEAEGGPLPGWSGDDQGVFRGNTHCRCRIYDGTVRWPNGKSLRELAGKTICLRFHLKHARLFTITASQSDIL